MVEVAAAGTGLLLALVLARKLGPAGYGAYAFSNALIGVTLVLALPGMVNAVTVAEARGHQSFLFQAVRRRLKWAPVVALVVAAIPFLPFVDKLDTPAAGWAMLAVAAGLNVPTVIIVGALGARREYWRLARLQLVSTGGTIVLVLGVPWLQDGTMAAAIQLLLLAAAQAWELRRLGGRSGGDEEDMRKLHRYASQMSSIGLIGVLETRIDVLVVGGAQGAVGVAGYALAAKLAEMLKRAWIVVNRVALPRWSRQHAHDAFLGARRLAIAWTLCGALATGATALIAVPFARLFFGTPTEDFGLIAIALVAASALGLPQGVFESFFTSRADARAIIAMRLGPGILFIVAAPIVAIAGGVLAVAALRVVHALLRTGIGLWCFVRKGRASADVPGGSEDVAARPGPVGWSA
jgi:O-antigen/teichoic acid export membrane protein